MVISANTEGHVLWLQATGSTGLDRLPALFLRLCAPALAASIAELFNPSLTTFF